MAEYITIKIPCVTRKLDDTLTRDELHRIENSGIKLWVNNCRHPTIFFDYKEYIFSKFEDDEPILDIFEGCRFCINDYLGKLNCGGIPYIVYDVWEHDVKLWAQDGQITIEYVNGDYLSLWRKLESEPECSEALFALANIYKESSK